MREKMKGLENRGLKRGEMRKAYSGGEAEAKTGYNHSMGGVFSTALPSEEHLAVRLSELT